MNNRKDLKLNVAFEGLAELPIGRHQIKSSSNHSITGLDPEG